MLDLPQRGAHQQLLAGHAPEVTGGVGVPLDAVAPLQVAGAGEGQAHVAVEGHAPLLLHHQPRVAVLDRVREVHRHPADGVDQLLEADQVHLDGVVDRDAEVGLDRVDERLGALGVRGVDPLLLAGPRDRHPQVPGDRQHVDALLARVDAHDGDAVGALAAGRALAEHDPRSLVALADPGAGIGADHQEIAGSVVLGVRQVQVLATELVERPQTPGRTGTRDERQHPQHRHGAEQEAAGPAT